MLQLDTIADAALPRQETRKKRQAAASCRPFSTNARVAFGLEHCLKASKGAGAVLVSLMLMSRKVKHHNNRRINCWASLFRIT